MIRRLIRRLTFWRRTEIDNEPYLYKVLRGDE